MKSEFELAARVRRFLARVPGPTSALLLAALFLSWESLGATPPQTRGATLSPALQEIFNRGVEAEKSGDLATAENSFLRVLDGGGKLAFVYNNLGTVYQQRGEQEKAIAQFRAAIRLDPAYAAPHVLLGASLLAIGNVNEAVRRLERGVQLAPHEPLARVELARAYERAENFAGAVQQYARLRELDPNNAEYAYQLGRAYLKLGGWCYERLARDAPGSARTEQSRGEMYVNQGKPELALRAFSRAAAADPQLAGIHLEMGEIYLNSGRLDEAMGEANKELAIAPGSAAASDLKRRVDAARAKTH